MCGPYYALIKPGPSAVRMSRLREVLNKGVHVLVQYFWPVKEKRYAKYLVPTTWEPRYLSRNSDKDGGWTNGEL
jgi:hypothetical protein